jgi:hypothetical protein
MPIFFVIEANLLADCVMQWPVLIFSFFALRLRLSHVPMAQFLMLVMFHVFWFMSYNPRLETLPLVTGVTAVVNAAVRRVAGCCIPLLVALWPWPGAAESPGIPQVTPKQSALGVCPPPPLSGDPPGRSAY